MEGTCRTNFAHRHKYKKVKSHVQDRQQAKIVEVEEDSDDEDGTAEYTLPEPFADEAEAKAAAKSKARSLKSETIRTTMTLFGDPTIRAGAPFRYQGVRPEIDDIEFIVETATHRLSKGGYVTEGEAKLKPDAKGKAAASAKSATAEAGSAQSGSSADEASGSVTSPAAAPVPTIPSRAASAAPRSTTSPQ